jgi:hypothetical protein
MALTETFFLLSLSLYSLTSEKLFFLLYLLNMKQQQQQQQLKAAAAHTINGVLIICDHLPYLLAFRHAMAANPSCHL